MSLSDTKLRKLQGKPQEKEFTLSDRDGLSVRVHKSGVLTFQYRYRLNKKQQRLNLGRYPALTLAEAREKIPTLKQQLKDGLNPKREQEIEVKKKQEALDVVECVNLFIEAHRAKYTSRTIDNYITLVTKHLSSAKLPLVNNITIHQWIDHFNGYKSQVLARTSAGQVKTALRWCHKQRLIDHNPLFDLKVSDIGEAPKKGQRVLTLGEVKSYIEILPSVTGSQLNKLCMLWIILTGCRQEEAREVEWSDIDLEHNVWTIPIEKSKKKNIQKRPLSKTLIKIVDQVKEFHQLFELKSDFLFIGGKLGNRLSESNIRRTNKYVFERMQEANPSIQHFTPHDFRRTLTSNLSDESVVSQAGGSAVMPHVTEKMLGHVLGGVFEVYNKHDWLNEQAQGYETWAQLIMPQDRYPLLTSVEEE